MTIPNFDTFNYNNSVFQLVFFVLLLFVIPAIIQTLLLNSIIGKKYRYFVAPGVIIHEYSHALFCLLTGAQIENINVFKRDGGEVVHTNSKIPLIGNVLISLAPLLIGFTIVYFLSKSIGITSRETLMMINFHDWKNWLILYLIISIVVTMTPSKQDIKNVAISLIVLIGIAFLLYKFTKVFTYISEDFISRTSMLLSTVNFVLLLVLIISFIIYILSKLAKRG